MGIFSTTVSIGNLEGGDHADVLALVDTGASDSMFPASLLEHLHVHPRTQVDYAHTYPVCHCEEQCDAAIPLAGGQFFLRRDCRASLAMTVLTKVGTHEVDYVLADGSEVTYGRGQAHISIGDRDGICPVIFGPDGADNCLIGATTLQILMLSVDSTNETLLPTARGRLGYGGNL